MFRIVAILALLGAVAGLAGIIRKSGQWARIKPEFKNFIRILRKRLKEQGLLKNFRLVVYLFSILMFMILAITGFFPALILGQSMSGVLLMLHVTVAPLFAVSLAILALLWAHRQQFTTDEWRWLAANLKKPRQLFAAHNDFWPKAGFWLILIVSLPAILSIILSMYPFFGTDGQHYLLNVHRYSVLILLVVVMFHGYWVVLESQSQQKKQ